MDIAVLSPHLDDAVLSLGGLIGREAAAGHSVEVVTCFTEGPPLDTVPPKRRVFADYTARRAELPAIRQAIGEMIDLGVLVYAPLGVGHHVDHVEVALAAMSAVAESEAFSRVRFYEDSYALSRLPRSRHFVTRGHLWPPFGAPAWASPRIGAMLFLIGLSARGPRPDDYLPEAARLEWTSLSAPLSATDEQRKLTAVAETAHRRRPRHQQPTPDRLRR